MTKAVELSLSQMVEVDEVLSNSNLHPNFSAEELNTFVADIAAIYLEALWKENKPLDNIKEMKEEYVKKEFFDKQYRLDFIGGGNE